MNILYIPSWYPTPQNHYSGTFIQNLAMDISNTDNQITVVYVQSGLFFPNKKTFIRKINNLIEHHLTFKFSPKGLPILQSAWVQLCLKKITNTIELNEIDLIHSHGYVSSFIGSKLATKYKKPHIVSYHFSGFLLDEIPKWRLNVLKKENTKIHICPSRSLADALNKKLNIKAEIIPNYIDNIPCKKKKTKTNNIIRCLSVMYLEEVKNPIRLIQEFAQLPLNYHLDIIGKGSLKEMMIQTIEDLQMSSRINIIPTMKREKLLELYQDYDIFISTSQVETFGMCMLEAIAAGVPVISVSHDGPSDFIQPQNGILSSLETLKDDILALIESDIGSEPCKISKTVDKFRKDQVIPRYLKLYKTFENS